MKGIISMMTEKKLMLGTGASATKNYDELLGIVRTAIENGISGFDTAPSYGTEEILAKAINEVIGQLKLERKDVFIQTKIDPWQMYESKGNIRYYIETVMKKMNVSYLDSLLIHWPLPEYLDSTWETFIKLKEEHVVNKIGICNLRVRQLETLEKKERLPEILQIERNPLFTCEKEIGFCKEHNIIVQAYSPLCKMHERIRENMELNDMAVKYKKSVGQIVLRWQLDTGVIPIFTSTKRTRVQEYADIFNFELTDEEIRAVTSLNINYKMYLESLICPGF